MLFTPSVDIYAPNAYDSLRRLIEVVWLTLPDQDELGPTLREGNNKYRLELNKRRETWPKVFRNAKKREKPAAEGGGPGAHGLIQPLDEIRLNCMRLAAEERESEHEHLWLRGQYGGRMKLTQSLMQRRYFAWLARGLRQSSEISAESLIGWLHGLNLEQNIEFSNELDEHFSTYGDGKPKDRGPTNHHNRRKPWIERLSVRVLPWYLPPGVDYYMLAAVLRNKTQNLDESSLKKRVASAKCREKRKRSCLVLADSSAWRRIGALD